MAGALRGDPQAEAAGGADERDDLLDGLRHGDGGRALVDREVPGHPGGVGTIHAGTAIGALRRMEQLIQEAVVTVPRARLAETIDLIAVLVRDGHGRRLAELARVEGLDAATGDLIWEYERGADAPGSSFGGPPGGRMHRNISIYQDKIYLNTADAHVVAIDARTGEEVWETDIDQGVGYQFSSGSIVADGKVVSGLTGCGRYREESCYIVGLDAQTGEEIWRTSTVALPGQRGGDTWGDLPPMFRAGSDSWIPGSYDPVTRTLFHGTSQAKPWARAVRGTDGDALYPNSTLALDPDTTN